MYTRRGYNWQNIVKSPQYKDTNYVKMWVLTDVINKIKERA